MDFIGLLAHVDGARLFQHGPRGERCFGIDRLDFADWPGWDVVDALKQECPAWVPLGTMLAEDAMLLACVQGMYEARLDSFGEAMGESLALAVVETCIDLGLLPTEKLLYDVVRHTRAAGIRLNEIPATAQLLLLKDFLLQRILSYPLVSNSNLRGLWGVIRTTKRLDVQMVA